MPTRVPWARAAKLAIRVNGGHTSRSTVAGSAAAPTIILSNCTAEATSPFIFQLPATSGRHAIIMASFVRQTAVSRPVASGKETFYQQVPSVAAQRGAPYYAPPSAEKLNRHHTRALDTCFAVSATPQPPGSAAS